MGSQLHAESLDNRRHRHKLKGSGQKYDKTFSGYLKKMALKGNQSYADSFENSGLKWKETSAFKNISIQLMIAHQASGTASS